ncbi:hypothetical protein UFOVP653_44 [uncultured Caudovirales phage]|uniref:Uncharacterized protein n=1 Tax=uncultured Caudovirales phage TaxID=2100421 RepID=A0A6J5N776_9CAUD|nr:hypothetical protein UFOVP653_44 [uncultured Caudovirales phage]
MTNTNFTTLRPWGDGTKFGAVGINYDALRGWFDLKDGSEGGGLWFDREDDGSLSLRDYDGVFALPAGVITALRGAGVVVDADFE